MADHRRARDTDNPRADHAATDHRDLEVTAQQAEDAADEAEEAAAEADQAADDAREAVRLAAPRDDPAVDTGVRRIEAGVDAENPFGRRGPRDAPRGEFRRIFLLAPFRTAFVAGLGVYTAILLVGAIVIARQVLVLILVAAFLAVGLDPAVRWLVRRGLRRGIAVGVIMVASLGFFGGFAAAVAPPIARQTNQLIQNAPSYVERLNANSTVRHFDDKYHFVEKLQQRANDVKQHGVSVDAFGGVFGVGKAILGFAAATLTVIILTMYFLANMPGMKRTLYRLAPRSRRARVGLLTDEILNRVGGFVLGNLFTSLIAGLATFVWLVAWRVPYPVALAMFVAITDLIPLIGATIGAIGVTAVALFQGVPTGIATFAFYVAYQQFENYILQPRVMKRAIDVAPVVTIVAALLGAALLGILGALIAVPLAAGVQLLLSEVVFPQQDEA